MKAAAGGAVLIAAALPMAFAGAASAATAPTLTCTAVTASCTSGFATVGQGYTGTVYLVGTGFANDAALGGLSSITTNATGVTFTNVVETSATTATATLTVPSSLAGGFYSVTLTDDNGTSAPLSIGLGVVTGPQITAVTGNIGTAGAAATTVTVTGTGLTGVSASTTGTGAPSLGAVTATSTSATFTVTPTATTGTFPITLTAPSGTGYTGGMVSFNYTVNAPAASSLSITSVSGLAYVATSGTTSYQNFTISGTGFETGAVVNLYTGGSCSTTCTTETAVSLTGATVTVTSPTTITVTNAAVTAFGPTQLDVFVHNPDLGTSYLTNGLGVGVAGSTGTSTNTPPVAPAISNVTYPGVYTALQASVVSIVYVTGSATFPLTTGSVVTLSPNSTSPSTDVLTGKVLSVTANTATVQLNVPAYGYTTVPAATAANASATTLVVSNSADIAPTGTVYLVQGSTITPITLTGNNTTTNTLSFASTSLPAISAGTVLEYAYPASSAFILKANNGTNTEYFNTVHVATPPASSILDAVGHSSSGDSFSPGTYSLNAFEPGFNFTTGASISFPAGSGITGTVTPVNANRATISFTVPASQPTSGITLNQQALLGSASIVLAGTITGTDLAAGSSLTIDAGLPNAETVVVASSYTSGATVPLTTTLKYPHNLGAAVSGINTPTGSAAIAGAVLLNGAGWGVSLGTLFNTVATPAAGTTTASPASIASGAVAQPITFTVPTTNGDTLGTDWTVTTTTAGVTFTVGTPTGTTVPTTVTVAPGTAVNASVPVVITNGVLKYTATIAIVAGPTITAITAVGALTVGGSENIGVTGTLFNATPASNACYFTNGGVTDAGVTCSINLSVTNSTTSLSLHVIVGASALNGTDTLVINNGAGIATFANALTVTGQPTVTATSPAVLTLGVLTPVSVTGTGFGTTDTVTFAEYDSTGTATTYHGSFSGTVTVTGGTSVTFNFTSVGTPGDTLVFTISNGTSTVMSGSVAEVGAPTATGITPSSIVVGSSNVPYTVTGYGFLPGATVSISAAAGTVTTTSVTPTAVSGNISILATATGPVTVTVTNANGGVTTTPLSLTAAPTITSPTSVNVAGAVSGSKGTLTIKGSGFMAGAVVSATTAGLVTFGTAVVTSSASTTNTCATNNCDTITVPVTYLSFTGSTPIVTGITVTNPAGFGTVTSANSLSINPAPSVTGVYYVPTFSTNVQVTINGSGFQTGMTATSTGSGYKILLVSVTPTTATLLVTTDSTATAGTSAQVTFTNADGGTVTFALNGGPAPVVTAPLSISSLSTFAKAGQTRGITIHGSGFVAGVSIASGHSGITFTVVGVSANAVRVQVKVAKGVHAGWSRLVLTNGNGKRTSKPYMHM